MTVRLRRLALAALLLMLAAPVAHARDVEWPSAAQSVAACVEDSHQLLVYVQLDNSRSLNRTDPDGLRAAGVKAAMVGLSTLAAGDDATPGVHVEVLLGRFAHDAEPASPQPSDWLPVERASLPRLKAAVDDFLRARTERETDYVLALEAAQEALDARAVQVFRDGHPPACKVVLFITDGKFQLKNRSGTSLPKTVHYAPKPNQRLDVKGGPGRAAEAGRRALCDPGGTMAQLDGDGIVTFAVALSASTRFTPEDRNFLGALATRRRGSERCAMGRSRGTGAYFGINQTPELVSTFARIVQAGRPRPTGICRVVPCAEGTGTFTVKDGLSSFDLTVTGTLDPDLAILLEGPHGGRRLLTDGQAGQMLAATPLTQDWLYPYLIAVHGDFPLDGAAWHGRWRYTLLTPTPGPPSSAQASVSLRSELKPRLVESDPVLWRGRRASLAVQLVDHEGQAVRGGELARSARLQAWIVDGNRDSHPAAATRLPDGTFRVRARIARDAPAGHWRLVLKARFAPSGAAVAPSFGFQRLPTPLDPSNPPPPPPRDPPWLLIIAIVALLALLLAWLLPRALRERQARLPSPARLRALVREARVMPGERAELEPPLERPELRDFPRVDQHARPARVRALTVGPFRLSAHAGAWRGERAQAEARVDAAGAAGARPPLLIGGTRGAALPGDAEHTVCRQLPLGVAGTWLFAIDHVDSAGVVHGRLAVVIDEDQSVEEHGSALLQAALEQLPAREWDALRPPSQEDTAFAELEREGFEPEGDLVLDDGWDEPQ